MFWDTDRGDRKESYSCVNEGCIHGKGYVFEDAPSEWFTGHNPPLDTPKNCPDCLSWRREQKIIGSIMAQCYLCGFTWPIYAGERRHYHRNVGNWDDYWAENSMKKICRMCEENPNRRRKLMHRREAHKARKKLREEGMLIRPTEYGKTVREDGVDVNDLFNLVHAKGVRQTNAYHVPDNLSFYSSLVERRGKTALDHIMKAHHKWPQNIGTNAPDSILKIAYHITVSTESHVLEFEAKGRVMKYDTKQRVCVMLKADERSPTGGRILTAYPTTYEEVKTKIETGDWKCA